MGICYLWLVHSITILDLGCKQFQLVGLTGATEATPTLKIALRLGTLIGSHELPHVAMII